MFGHVGAIDLVGSGGLLGRGEVQNSNSTEEFIITVTPRFTPAAASFYFGREKSFWEGSHVIHNPPWSNRILDMYT